MKWWITLLVIPQPVGSVAAESEMLPFSCLPSCPFISAFIWVLQHSYVSSSVSKTLHFCAHCCHFITNQTLFQHLNMFIYISWVISLINFICTWLGCSSWPLSPCPHLFLQVTFVWKSLTLPTEGTLLPRKGRLMSQLIHFPTCSHSRTSRDKLYFIRLLHLHASAAAAFGACPQCTACKWPSHEIVKETLMPVAHEDEFQ